MSILSHTYISGDCRQMSLTENESVDLIVTSPLLATEGLRAFKSDWI